MQYVKISNEKNKKHVLVVDEHFTFRHFLSLALRAHGYECVEAEEYSWAHSFITQNVFDLVLTDFRTFMKSESASCLHESSPKMLTPTIFLIGEATDKAMELAQRLGARAIFEKRGDLDELLEKIQLKISSERVRAER